MRYGARRLRWNVEVHYGGIPDKHWGWIEEEGPWYLNTEDPPPEEVEAYDFDEYPLADYLDIDADEPHRCPTIELLRLRATPAAKPRATFEVSDFHFGNYLVRLTAHDQPSRKSGRISREVELVISPDLSDAGAQALGAEEHPFHKRDDESLAEVQRFRRP